MVDIAVKMVPREVGWCSIEVDCFNVLHNW